jgi:hypothetical protein
MRALAVIAVAVLRNPVLWPTAARLLLRTARRGWWHRRPFLPLPSREYVRFRLLTQYGVAATPTQDDVVNYLRWCRDWPPT